MSEGIDAYIKKKFEVPDVDIRTYSPLTLAYIGDGVFDLVIRSVVVGKGNTRPNQLHHRTSQIVKAHTQAVIIQYLEPMLTEEEADIYRRGRNAKSATMAKNATMADYRKATGLEALVGYLYLTDRFDRLVSLIMEDEKKTFTGMKENHIEGRNAVLEAFRSGRTIDKLYVLDGCQDGPVRSITREARKHDTIVNYVTKERLDQISETGKHQGVIAVSAAYDYARVEDILALAEKKGEPPFILILDGIEDPHNLGAIIRTANQAGAHGVIIPKRRAVGLTPTVARTSAGAVNYVPVAKVTNISNTMKELKDRGMWFVCADMDGTLMYDMDLTGPIGLVIGNEGDGVSPLVKKNCDMVASIPMKGDIDSLNASVAAGVLSYEIVRQRMKKG